MRLALLFLAACSPSAMLEPNAPIYLAPVPAIVELTTDVATRINAAYGQTIIIVGDKPGAIAVRQQCGERRGDLITIGPCGCADGGQSMAVVLVHELGHVFLGSQHSDDPSSIMFEHYRSMTTDEAVDSLVTELRR